MDTTGLGESWEEKVRGIKRKLFLIMVPPVAGVFLESIFLHSGWLATIPMVLGFLISIGTFVLLIPDIIIATQLVILATVAQQSQAAKIYLKLATVAGTEIAALLYFALIGVHFASFGLLWISTLAFLGGVMIYTGQGGSAKWAWNLTALIMIMIWLGLLGETLSGVFTGRSLMYNLGVTSYTNTREVLKMWRQLDTKMAGVTTKERAVIQKKIEAAASEAEIEAAYKELRDYEAKRPTSGTLAVGKIIAWSWQTWIFLSGIMLCAALGMAAISGSPATSRGALIALIVLLILIFGGTALYQYSGSSPPVTVSAPTPSPSPASGVVPAIQKLAPPFASIYTPIQKATGIGILFNHWMVFATVLMVVVILFLGITTRIIGNPELAKIPGMIVFVTWVLAFFLYCATGGIAEMQQWGKSGFGMQQQQQRYQKTTP